MKTDERFHHICLPHQSEQLIKHKVHDRDTPMREAICAEFRVQQEI